MSFSYVGSPTRIRLYLIMRDGSIQRIPVLVDPHTAKALFELGLREGNVKGGVEHYVVTSGGNPTDVWYANFHAHYSEKLEECNYVTDYKHIELEDLPEAIRMEVLLGVT